ncbi:hypothetical protein LVD15_21930 [Fulvivirga maritima]|uniref:hypothetical protein n=1 Tax=Fulvivirga maritima TaxID=2904247 RepID=UPI001F382D5A|nr:hypothetical protein [Fulvivirga maritima]UII25933.1 hypothetical protein LVD15_21930 [Fulvivirga maritima]
MIDSYKILHTEWLWPVLMVSIFLFVGLLIKEVTRKNKQHLIIRIFCSFVFIISTSLLILKIQEKGSYSDNYVAILTPGYNESQLDSLQVHYPKLEKTKVTDQIPQDILDKAGFILGDGIPAYNLGKMNAASFQYLEGKPLNGIIKLDYNKFLTIGETLNINGRFNAQEGSTNKLFLELDGLVLDSAKVTGNNHAFKLKTTVKAAGKFLFSIVLKDSMSHVISTGPLPVAVDDEKLKKILFINQFPTFELKYLKNYLSEEGHQILVRNELSSNKFKFEYYNTAAKNLRYITETLLNTIDLVVIDSKSLDKFSNSELVSLKAAVSEKGMGLFIIPDENYTTRKPTRIWDAFIFTPLKEAPKLKLYPKIEISPYGISKNLLTTSIIKSQGNRNVAATSKLGKGNIGTSLLRNTYSLWLSGQKDDYKQLWNKIVSGVISETNDQWIDLKNPIPVFKTNTPYQMVIASGTDSSYLINKLHFPLQKDVYTHTWYTELRPESEGWNYLAINDSTAINYYVEDESWSSLNAYKTRQTNKSYFTNKIDNKLVAESNIKWKEANYWLLFCLLILSAGYLWLEPKL